MPYGPIVLVALLVEYVLVLTADVLNLRALRPEIPEQFRGLYDADRYARSQEYTRAKTRFSWWPKTVDLVLLLGFWWLGGFRWLDDVVRGFGFGPVVTGVLFVSALLIVHGAIALPFRWHATFVIEERFGFNKTTRRTFVMDTLKGLLLGAVLGLPLLAVVLWFFETTGERAWWYCWIVGAAFTLAIQFVAPTWIMPLFNKFKPLEDGELKASVLAYSKTVGFPLEGLFVIDGSKRSTKANAFFTGFGKHKRVALFDTLIAQQTTEELVAVVAHEIGHYKLRHILKGMLFGLAQMGLTLFILSRFLNDPALFAAFGLDTPSTHAGLVFFGLVFAPIDLALSIVMQAMSRKNEFEADAFARKTTGRGEVLARALEKLSAESLSNLTPHPFYVKLHHSHPPLAERVAALRA